jgi:hypothetical protein
MIRRSLLAAVALVLVGGAGAQALAAAPALDLNGDHTLCLMAGNSHTGSQDGLCVWVPTT